MSINRNYCKIQGDRVLVRRTGREDRLFKVVRLMDVNGQQLRLIHVKNRLPDWALTDNLRAALQPASPAIQAAGAQWLLTIR